MIGRFRGGKLGGHPFNIAGMNPPKGLDVVAPNGAVQRYRFTRVASGVAEYDFTEDRQKPEGHTIDVGGVSLVPLPYYPKPKA